MITTPRNWKTANVGAFVFCAWLLGGSEDSGFLQKVLVGSFGANRQINFSVERDVDAPDVFRVSEASSRDGRPFLEGIWVAYAETDIPGRVIIRNGSNKKFVIDALFRRNTVSPGPRLVLSSEVAAALGVSAGVSANLIMVALQKRSMYESTSDQSRITSGSASRKIKISSTAPASTPSTSTAPPVKFVGFDFDKPFIQLVIFGVEQNAKNSTGSVCHMGVIPIVKKLEKKRPNILAYAYWTVKHSRRTDDTFSKSKVSWI